MTAATIRIGGHLNLVPAYQANPNSYLAHSKVVANPLKVVISSTPSLTLSVAFYPAAPGRPKTGKQGEQTPLQRRHRRRRAHRTDKSISIFSSSETLVYTTIRLLLFVHCMLSPFLGVSKGRTLLPTSAIHPARTQDRRLQQQDPSTKDHVQSLGTCRTVNHHNQPP